MFICEECIKNYVITGVVSLFLKSVGPCEDCHKQAICYDIPHNRYYRRDSQYGRQLRLERGETITIRNAPELFSYIKWQIDQCSDVDTLQKVLRELGIIAQEYWTTNFNLTVDKNRKLY